MSLGIGLTPKSQVEQLERAARADVDLAKELYVRRLFAQQFNIQFDDPRDRIDRLMFAAKALEHVGSDLLNRHYHDRKVSDSAWRNLIWPAFRLRRSIGGQRRFADLWLYLDEAIDGVLANRQPELRYALEDAPLDVPLLDPGSVSWPDYLRSEISRAFLLLIRKHGREDILSSLEVVANLRCLQKAYEQPYLTALSEHLRETQEGTLVVRVGLSELVALYNIARMVEVVGEYLVKGHDSQYGSIQGIKDEIDRLTFSAKEVTRWCIPDLLLCIGRLGSACKALVDASVFSVTLPTHSRQMLLSLASRKYRPVLELWYAQREALRQSLLDPTRTAVVVSMPTSAGKTLLAELAMLEVHRDDPTKRIVYLAPTRALVTQVSLTLKRDLSGSLGVRIATPSFELNPVEADLLSDGYDVLVTTPEKMDLLMRENHPSVRSISLVIVDEAHSLNDGERGAHLELLLANLRRERFGCRYILLTPFAAKSAQDLAFWLGGEQGTPIVVDWKPNDRVIGAVTLGKTAGRKREQSLVFKTLDTPHSDCPGGVEIPFAEIETGIKRTKKDIAHHAVLRWAAASKGGVLLLASSRHGAVTRARRLAEDLPGNRMSASVDLVCRYLDAEVAGRHPLSDLLPRGVAFHHAGLSPEGRYFVERLIEEGAIRILCATTTLAHGVHFPLSVAVVEDHRRSIQSPRWKKEELKPWEFWNIAGRVGRTLEDSLGVVAFAAENSTQVSAIHDYLQKDASVVSSVLLQFLSAIKDQDNIQFSPHMVDKIDGASAFLQYLLHALATAGRDLAFNDLEGILRASFVFQQAMKSDPAVADAMIRIARAYLKDLSVKKGESLDGYAQLVDRTGFSSPSMDVVMREWPRGREDPGRWSVANVFPANGSASDVLVKVINTLKRIPEIRLGTEQAGKLNAERIARVTTLWVSGASIVEIANREYRGDVLKCTYHIYGTISGKLPWGLRAIQRVAFSGQSDEAWDELSLLPAMVYHGVRSKEALALRMLNVPRIAAEGLARQIRETETSLDDIPNWLETANDQRWDAALPPGSHISGRDLRRLWQVLEGKRNWQDIST